MLTRGIKRDCFLGTRAVSREKAFGKLCWKEDKLFLDQDGVLLLYVGFDELFAYKDID